MNLRPAQAAQHLGIGISKLYAMVKSEPDFPQGTKLGPRTRVFRLEDLDRWMEQRTRASTRAAVKRQESSAGAPA